MKNCIMDKEAAAAVIAQRPLFLYQRFILGPENNSYIITVSYYHIRKAIRMCSQTVKEVYK